MSSQPVFSLEQVNALIPELNELVGQQLVVYAEIERSLERLAHSLGKTPESIRESAEDSPETAALKADLRSLIARYEGGWRHVQELGAVVKDPSIGLLDFYGSVGGRLVWLCWRYGEDSLGYYHDLQSGYSGRRPLDRGERRALLN